MPDGEQELLFPTLLQLHTAPPRETSRGLPTRAPGVPIRVPRPGVLRDGGRRAAAGQGAVLALAPGGPADVPGHRPQRPPLLAAPRPLRPAHPRDGLRVCTAA